MQPLFNSFPQCPNQIQNNGTTAPGSQQVFPSNHALSNSCNMLQNSMPMQPQMGIMNPQIPISSSNSNMQPLITHPGFRNAPNHLLPSQNNHIFLPQLGSVGPMSQSGHCNVGFGPQHGVHNFNNVPMFSVHGPQVQGQFVRNLPNLPQQLNQNMGLPNGQFCLQNPMQNMNPPLLPMQMSNPSQVVPYGVPPCSQQTLGCLNPTFFANPQFGLAYSNGQQLNQSHQNLIPPTVDVNSWKPSATATQQVQGNSHTSLNSCSIQSQQTQNLQPSVFTSTQGNPGKNGQNNISNSNWKKFPSKNFTRYPKKEASQQGFQKSQFHRVDNAKRKFGFCSEHKGRGHDSEKRLKFGQTNSANQAREKKRSLALNYTEQEIQQWREDRRKNYPSNGNIEKKLTGKLTDSEVIDREAKLRREQLKEILAKQAELGVEVAEIPSYYLSDPEKQVHCKEESVRPLNRRGRFQNKHGRRGRNNKKDQLAKKQKVAQGDSLDISSFNKRKPTLLQKLLSSDLRRDKSHLLQVFRFMVMNSFFIDWPEKPLKFPLVVVEESGCRGEVVEAKSSIVGKDVSEGSDKAKGENFVDDIDDDDDADAGGDDDGNENDDDGNDKLGSQVEQVAYFVGEKSSIGEEVERHEEEEGEIID